MQTFRKAGAVSAALRRGDLLLRIIAGTVLFAMMGLTVCDVVMRYWFDSSIAGAFEITELLLVLLIFAGFPLVSKSDQHVSVDVLEGWFSDRVKRNLSVARQAVATVVLGTMSWLLWERANIVLEYNDVTAILRISILPVVCIMFALTVVTTLVHVTLLVRAVEKTGARSPGDPSAPDDPTASSSSLPGPV